MGIAAIRFGTGFSAPPPANPFPLFSPTLAQYQPRVEESERVVLDTVNQVLGAAAFERLIELKDMFDGVARDFVTSFPELDHYLERENANYCGPIDRTNARPEPAWPGDNEPRVFAYLKREYAHFRPVIAQLADTGANVLIHAGPIDRPILDHYASSNLAFIEQPVDLARTAARADVVVCHAGHATAIQCLLAGTPLTLLPMYREQDITAERVIALEAGAIADPVRGSAQLGASIETVLSGCPGAATADGRGAAARATRRDPGTVHYEISARR